MVQASDAVPLMLYQIGAAASMRRLSAVSVADDRIMRQDVTAQGLPAFILSRTTDDTRGTAHGM